MPLPWTETGTPLYWPVKPEHAAHAVDLHGVGEEGLGDEFGRSGSPGMRTVLA